MIIGSPAQGYIPPKNLVFCRIPTYPPRTPPHPSKQ